MMGFLMTSHSQSDLSLKLVLFLLQAKMSHIFEPENMRVALFWMVYIKAHQIISFSNLPNAQKMPYNYFKFEGIGVMHFRSTI